ncbi:TetR/AcrR family transcriptional regulator [Candidatus Mycobacterium methanotrophicum]|uniref:TetR/AcrR family transcriptional regulator n=1 Tax=Candidatus Mycobacterium methanotrophicum TaxID=2943498 RepID=A0ABY4QRY6_9MYCO|nr:TetR/AcrR family transcriptional regulator [Candidatus Mycobacterium methanotrophicum]UQX12751.1 TetR/AcrR family transcriptional regulator [Candidatus Mycobacterium methanotrophicum]
MPLTEIADAAGVGVGTFYRGIPNRAALLDELQRRGYDLLLDSLARIRAGGLTGADATEVYLNGCLSFADQLVALPLRGVEQLRDDAAVTAKNQVLEAIGGFLAEGQADGSVHADVTALDIAVCGTRSRLHCPTLPTGRPPLGVISAYSSADFEADDGR